MNMADIRHRIGIAAPPEQVYEAISTIDGLSQWWTRDVDGDPTSGGTLRFYFGQPEPSIVMKVSDTKQAEHVGWSCVSGAQEWIGSKVTFDLSSSDGETVLLFEHANWREPTEFMSHCSTKWAYFLIGLKASLEGGAATPFPGELQLSGSMG
jgi:uncharacterized protein YndB with AHSA1/START domain